jgi:hypothetical protein
MAVDIAISTQAGWFGQTAADREAQEIADNVTGASVQLFTSTQHAALAAWVTAHTGDGKSDLLILCGQFPDTIYPAGNTKPDGSIAELFLDDGNCIVNTGDWIFYVVNGAGTNAAGGLQNMMDIPGVTVAGDDNMAVAVTADAQLYTPSLLNFATDRPFHLDTLANNWEAELILAQNAAGTRADPVIVVNSVTGGRIGIFYQTASQDNDPRGEVISEWINNWYLPNVGRDEFSSEPSPESKATDVHRDVVLSWKAGNYAATHDVYFGTSFDDVNAASTSDPRSVLVSQGQTDAAFDPEGLLEYGQTYYWRIDEVNAAPDYTTFKGEVWSFTVEAYGYAITNVTATASSAQPASPAINTINGSGLDDLDQHGVDLKTMWVTPGDLPAWIQYTFDKEYKLHELQVWNSNSELEALMGFGAKDVVIEYSTDGETWTALENVPQFTQGTGKTTYTANTTVDLGEVMAKHVKLTINDNWGVVSPIVSLSEVRFFYTPAQAFEPTPTDAATDIALDATLTWRPGREATSHQVYFGTDADAVAAGTAASKTVADHSYTPGVMDFGTTYYWKVDEVGDAGTYAGDVWSFTTKEFSVAEDFESYNDDIDAETTIWHAWIDGLTTQASGSTVGYENSPFAEKSIVHGGKQSMPLAYDNASKFYFSETTREFETAQNWTANGADNVCIWTQGYPAVTATTVTETSGKMNLTGAGSDIWGNSDEFTYAYKTLAGDGALIARVVSNGTGTNTWAKGGVMIRDGFNGGSTHAIMAMTGSGGNGASFQYRTAANGTSGNADSSSTIAPPYWVKIERTGETFKGSVSADGKTWTQIGTTAIAMTDPVYIGLAVTSHEKGVDRTYQFDNISSTGTISGAWQGAVINSPRYNDAANMSLTIADSAGKNGAATSATAVTAADWTRWVIPMSNFAGVNFAKVKKLTITIGDKNATTAGGTGMVFIDDISFGHAAE